MFIWQVNDLAVHREGERLEISDGIVFKVICDNAEIFEGHDRPVLQAGANRLSPPFPFIRLAGVPTNTYLPLMDFTEIQFTTIDEFLRIMLKKPLNFVLFNDAPRASFADSLTLEADEGAYYVDVRQLNEECFQRMMVSSVIDRRAYPGMPEIKPIPQLVPWRRGRRL